MIEAERPLVGAIDWGGSKVEVALFDAAGAVVCTARLPPTLDRPEATLATAARCLERLVRSVQRPPTCLAGVGVAVPGMVDRARGVLLFAPDHGARDLDVRGGVQIELGAHVRVEIDNDVRAAARAEARALPGAGSDMLWLTVSSGVGGALVLGGEVRDGVSGLAGEIGHVTVEPDGERCGCGRRGCLQTVCAAPALVRAARRIGLDVSTAADLGALRRAGDDRAEEVFAHATRHLARVLADVVTIVDVDVIRIGGGVGLALDASAIGQTVRGNLLEADRRRLDVQHTTLGPAASLVGAARLVAESEGAPC